MCSFGIFAVEFLFLKLVSHDSEYVFEYLSNLRADKPHFPQTFKSLTLFFKSGIFLFKGNLKVPCRYKPLGRGRYNTGISERTNLKLVPVA